MPVNESKRKANDKWDAENMSYQTIKVRKELLEEFKEICHQRGDKVNTVLVDAIRAYIEENR